MAPRRSFRKTEGAFALKDGSRSAANKSAIELDCRDRSSSSRSRRSTISSIYDLKSSRTGNKTLAPARHASLDARKIYLLELRKRRSSTYTAPKFNDDLRKILSVVNLSAASSPQTEQQVPENKVKRLQFHDVTIREYPIICGDNPAGTKGPPLTIGWDCVSSVSISHETYERARGPNRRRQEQMKMVSMHRENILKNLDFSRKEIDEATKAANNARYRRHKTNAHDNGNQEKLESFRRGVSNVLTFGAKKRREQAYLKKHVPSYGKPKTWD
jgi:hypothetical protein